MLKLNPQRREKRGEGLLIVNADDWGRDKEITDRMLECVLHGSVSSVSAMVFMEDSERASAIAHEKGVPTGLHLNFTTAFSGRNCSVQLAESLQRISSYLLNRRLNRVVFNPGLMRSFEYAVKSQFDEYERLYGRSPERIDGHHHMHVCANVLFGRLLPKGTVARRNFSFEPGEKNLFNRAYRRFVDGVLAREHRITDYFFSLPPLEPQARLERIFSLARGFVVEVETHPVNPAEYRFLLGEEFKRLTADLKKSHIIPAM